MPETELAQLEEPVATAVGTLAGKANEFTFKALSETPRVEICSDNPIVRTTCRPVVASFTSKFWPVR